MLLSIFIISFNIGTFAIGPIDVIKTFFGQGDKKQELVLFTMRLPRIIIALLVASALAVSGTVLQGITKNDLADPGILGISSGAALAVVIYIYFMNGKAYSDVSLLTIFTMPIIALFGAGFAAFLIYTLAWKKGINPTRLILMGIGINSAFSAILVLFQFRFLTQDFNKIMIWTSGSIWGTNWSYVIATLPFVFIFTGLIIYKARYLDVLSLGDELSVGLGVNIEKERRTLLIYTVALAGSATAVAGTIAFLGLISPHIARKLVGPKHKLLLPVSALVSSIILLLSDTIAKNVLAPIEMPVGIVVSIIGVPYFIYLIMKE
ncbi:FecCD family ABC transporter permease [Clostridium estertheticum]|uniref:FecCD family ABC transporter permease n=1 Tax=Clostridium estertheticum TaxID=238834 RepID=UPI001A9B1B76|nr:iron ABC transporter permease [Clostridium estertheticum]WBL48843.1 iron ABC transporter permease [Clostridium estertheticum]